MIGLNVIYCCLHSDIFALLMPSRPQSCNSHSKTVNQRLFVNCIHFLYRFLNKFLLELTQHDPTDSIFATITTLYRMNIRKRSVNDTKNVTQAHLMFHCQSSHSRLGTYIFPIAEEMCFNIKSQQNYHIVRTNGMLTTQYSRLYARSLWFVAVYEEWEN